MALEISKINLTRYLSNVLDIFIVLKNVIVLVIFIVFL